MDFAGLITPEAITAFVEIILIEVIIVRVFVLVIEIFVFVLVGEIFILDLIETQVVGIALRRAQFPCMYS